MKRDAPIAAGLNKYAITLAEAEPGDIGVAHSRGILGWIIRFGTRSIYNHAFVLVSVGPTPETTTVIQAEARGVELSTLDKVAPGGFYAIMPLPQDVDPDLVVDEAKSLLRVKYAFVSVVSIAFGIITKALHIPFRLAVRDTLTLICSAVCALSLLAGGWVRAPFPDLYQVTPADLAVALVADAALAHP